MSRAGPSVSSDGVIPRSTRKGPAIRSARSRGVTNLRLAQSVPSRASLSPMVCPIACEGTMIHLQRVGCVAHRPLNWSTNGSTCPRSPLNVTRSPRAVCLVFTVRGRYDSTGQDDARVQIWVRIGCRFSRPAICDCHVQGAAPQNSAHSSVTNVQCGASPHFAREFRWPTSDGFSCAIS
jgi:hypothetical protein